MNDPCTLQGGALTACPCSCSMCGIGLVVQPLHGAVTPSANGHAAEGSGGRTLLDRHLMSRRGPDLYGEHQVCVYHRPVTAAPVLDARRNCVLVMDVPPRETGASGHLHRPAPAATLRCVTSAAPRFTASNSTTARCRQRRLPVLQRGGVWWPRRATRTQ